MTSKLFQNNFISHVTTALRETAWSRLERVWISWRLKELQELHT